MTPNGPGGHAEAVAVVRAITPLVPRLAVIAGSGLSGLADRLERAVEIPFTEMPGWPRATAPGHVGRLAIGHLGGVPTAIALGRAHLYEGHAPSELTFGVRALHALGARTLIATNAAGGLDPAWEPGDVMVIADHVFLPGLAGASPLRGPNDAAAGPRFPGMVDAYDPRLRRLALHHAPAFGLVAREGVYAMVAGPSFETPAEARFLLALGADAVGMSTAPEIVAARHLGMRCLGVSLVTNRVALTSGGPPSAPDLACEVLAQGAASAPRMAAWIEALAPALDED